MRYLKKATTWVAPDVVELIAPDGVRFVMKDWSSRSLIFRYTWCRVAAAREIRTYEALRGMQGVPQLICRLGSLGFIMEWLDARPLPRSAMADLLGMEFFRKLDEILDEMHRRGVAHGDLRRRNILRGVDGNPKIIDFETAVHAKHSNDGGKLFRAVRDIDRITVLKIRARYFPESLSPEERERLDQVPWHLAAGRVVRKRMYAPFTKKGRRRIARRKEKSRAG